MSRNMEIKARLQDRKRTVGLAQSITGRAPEVINQEDVFFYCESGRLKLRILSDSNGELIHYRRNDNKGPKTSKYSITRTEEPAKLRKIMEEAYGSRAVVKKTRLLFLVGRTRIHIDSVENLGDFVELEAVLEGSEDKSIGENNVNSLMKVLEIRENDLVEGAYVDLIEGKNLK